MFAPLTSRHLYVLQLQPSDRINLGFETLLETGVDEMSWDDTVSAGRALLF